MKWFPSILAFGSGATPPLSVSAASSADDVDVWVRVAAIVVSIVLAIFQQRKNGRRNKRPKEES